MNFDKLQLMLGYELCDMFLAPIGALCRPLNRNEMVAQPNMLLNCLLKRCPYLSVQDLVLLDLNTCCVVFGIDPLPW
jgi:hypothetical protein